MSLSDITIGSRIKFQSLALNDPNIYVGTVKSLMTYDVAIAMHDIVSSTENVKQAHSSLAHLDYKLLEYFILELEEGSSSQSRKIVFAKEWINEPTFSIIGALNTITIKVYGVTTEQTQEVLELLSANDFTVQLVSVS